MRGLPAARRQDPVRRDHALEVIGVGFLADQHDLLAAFGPRLGGRRIEHRAAHCSARRGGHPLRQQLAGGRPVELREHQQRQLRTGDPGQRLVHRDQVLVDQLPSDPERRRSGALPDPGLQHPQLAALDGELDIAQVPVVRLQPAHHLHQLLVRRRVQRLQIVQRQGVPDAGDDILALRIGQVVPVRAGPTGRRVTGERNAGAAGLAQVAEHHRADVHRGTQVLRDPLPPPVQPRPIGVPGVEDSVDRHVQLLARVLRELLTGVLPHRVLERGDQRLQIIDIEVDVAGHTLGRLRLVQRIGEHLAGHLQHRLAEHLQQPPVGIPGEALVAGFLGKPLHAGVVKPDVQHRLHHSGHRKRRTGTNTHQQRIVAITEPATDVVLQLPQCHRDLHSQLTGFAALRQVLPASLRRDGESGRHRQPQFGHLGQVRALATQQVLLVLVALGEVEHVLGHQVLLRWVRRRNGSAGGAG